MWVDFVVGSWFTLREMSGVVLLKSLGGRFFFGRPYQRRGEGRYRKEALHAFQKFYVVVFFFSIRGIRSEKNSAAYKILQGKKLKPLGYKTKFL